jgi:hypothetical protein
MNQTRTAHVTKKALLLIAGVAVLLATTAAVSACASAEESQDTSKPKGAKPKEAQKKSNKATDDNEPHVGRRGTVIVDTLTWRVNSAKTARQLGSDFIRETPDGIYVVAVLTVTNGKNESATLNSSQISYEVGDKAYESDTEGTTALMFGEDKDTFFLKDLGPDVTTKGSVVFDVPLATLKQGPEVCFGELGFGSTKGCIKLPL